MMPSARSPGRSGRRALGEENERAYDPSEIRETPPLPGRSLPRPARRARQDDRLRSRRQFAVSRPRRGRRPARTGTRAHRGTAGSALRRRSLGAAADLPGDGRRGQGQRHQTRAPRPQPAGQPRRRVQGARLERARSRLHVALHERNPAARPHRHLQPVVLRGSAGGEGRARRSGGRKPAGVARDEADLDRIATRTSTPPSGI